MPTDTAHASRKVALRLAASMSVREILREPLRAAASMLRAVQLLLSVSLMVEYL
jgi:hypothetical protein